MNAYRTLAAALFIAALNPANTALAASYSSTTSSTPTPVSTPTSSPISSSPTQTPSPTPSPCAAAPGYFCALGAAPAPCPAGRYSSAVGAIACLPCPAGVFGASAGLSSAACSGACAAPPGAGCPAGSTAASAAVQCPSGFYCPGGSPAPALPCLVPANCAAAGLAAEPPCVWNASTLAGDGSGSILTDGYGTMATFRSPRSLALSGTVLYVADHLFLDDRVRRVTPEGLVSSLAGGSCCSNNGTNGIGTAVQFVNLGAISVDPSTGVLFVVENSYGTIYGGRIRQITPMGATLTLAGTVTATGTVDGIGTAARFSDPRAITIDAAGLVYVGESWGAIRRITPSGSVSTLRGATSIFSGMRGIALDKLGNIYLSSDQGIGILFFNGSFASVAGPFGINPIQIAMTANGNVAFADYNHAIRQVTPSGYVSNIINNAYTAVTRNGIGFEAGFKNPAGIAISPEGVIYSSEIGFIRQISCVPCPSSYYCAYGDAYICPVGRFCPPSNNFAPPVLCPAGTYNLFVGAISNSSCLPCPSSYFCALGRLQICPTGNYCPPAINFPVLCPSGTFTPSTGGGSNFSCLSCPSGTYSRPGASICCPPGAGVIPGQNFCSDCPIDTYSIEPGQYTCSTCSTNFYATTGAAVCCSLGFWSAPRSFFCNACPAGTWSGTPRATSASACQPCPSGTWSPTPGISSAAQCIPCAAGFYCPLNSSIQISCPVNTYRAFYSATSLADCLPCANGTISALGAASCTVIGGGSCSAGTYVNPAAGALCLPCVAGTYSSSNGAAVCTPCSPGHYSGSGAAACQLCPQGSFCVGGLTQPCPAGSFGSVAGADSAVSCARCPPGTYNPSPGGSSSAACSSCPIGSFSNTSGAAACTQCAPGSASGLVGATSPSACEPCAAGSFSSLPGQLFCSAYCPKGTMGIKEGGVSAADACAPCPLGYFASSSGSIECAPCALGTFAGAPGASSCTSCPQGRFSNVAAAVALSNCSACPAGSFGVAAGSTSAGCIQCSPGTASAAPGASSALQCVACAPGSYAPLAGSAACIPAPPGAFTGAGAASPSACALGTFSSRSSATSQADCAPCPAGKTTTTTGATLASQCLALPFVCPLGFQPRTAAPAALADCAPLACSAPLVPEAASGANASQYCLGCGAGSAGAVGACAPCVAGAGLCPGLTQRPLWDFSAPLAPAAAAAGALQRTSPWAACSTLAAFCASTVAESLMGSSAASIARSNQALIGGAALFALLLVSAFLALRASPRAQSLLVQAVKAVDLYSLAHRVKEQGAPVKRTTALGGIFALMGLTTIATYAAFLTVQWFDNNVRRCEAAAGRLATLPLSFYPSAPSSPPLPFLDSGAAQPRHNDAGRVGRHCRATLDDLSRRARPAAAARDN